MKDILSGEVLCKPTSVELSKIVEEPVKCKSTDVKCCKSKIKVAIKTEGTGHQLSVCNADNHVILNTLDGGFVTLCESLVYKEAGSKLKSNSKALHI